MSPPERSEKGEERGRRKTSERERDKGRERESGKEMNLNSNEKRRTNTREPISVDVIVFLTALPVHRERRSPRRVPPLRRIIVTLRQYRHVEGEANDPDPLADILRNTSAPRYPLENVVLVGKVTPDQASLCAVGQSMTLTTLLNRCKAVHRSDRDSHGTSKRRYLINCRCARRKRVIVIDVIARSPRRR